MATNILRVQAVCEWLIHNGVGPLQLGVYCFAGRGAVEISVYPSDVTESEFKRLAALFPPLTAPTATSTALHANTTVPMIFPDGACAEAEVALVVNQATHCKKLAGKELESADLNALKADPDLAQMTVSACYREMHFKPEPEGESDASG